MDEEPKHRVRIKDLPEHKKPREKAKNLKVTLDGLLKGEIKCFHKSFELKE